MKFRVCLMLPPVCTSHTQPYEFLSGLLAGWRSSLAKGHSHSCTRILVSTCCYAEVWQLAGFVESRWQQLLPLRSEDDAEGGGKWLHERVHTNTHTRPTHHRHSALLSCRIVENWVLCCCHGDALSWRRQWRRVWKRRMRAKFVWVFTLVVCLWLFLIFLSGIQSATIIRTHQEKIRRIKTGIHI